jgi:HPt (histidine-containing phosphotransfer) domain-containing protein
MFERRTPELEKPTLDTGYLARLGGHLGASVMAELLADGLIELTDRLTRLEELAAVGDLDGIARLGHDLVGMAGHLGLSRLSAAAAEMNRAAREGAAGQAVAIVAEIRWLGADSVDAMRRHLDGVSSG